jgi:hypothetical protein
LLDFSMYVDGGVQKTWTVTGADLGWGSGAGTYFGQLETDEFNGVAWHCRDRRPGGDGGLGSRQ